MFSLENKVAIVTGSAQGIGKEIASSMTKLGATVYVNDVNEAKAHETARSIGAKEAIIADVTKQEEVKHMIERVVSNEGRIDILVNNAGIIGIEDFGKISLEKWNTMLNVHLNGAFLCSQAAVMHMKKQKSGKIINIPSNWGQRGAAGAVHYSTAKAGIIGFTKALARELAKDGIQVNSVAPGPIETEMIDEEARLLGKSEEELRSDLLQTIPAGRLGKPMDIAGAVCYLASELGDFYYGQVISPNGGEVI